ncbi:MAG: S-layer protein, partial [Prosthecobacter sp.]|nr:S-layer protein [Prosthecobacter sp.]
TTKATAMLATAKPEDRRTTLEDIFWSLMGSKEFLFNH